MFILFLFYFSGHLTANDFLLVPLEKPNKGRTIIEKFEHHAGLANYTFILLTPDDIGGDKYTKKFDYRARQNVIFELGFFIGKLGRDRVCYIYKKMWNFPLILEASFICHMFKAFRNAMRI